MVFRQQKFENPHNLNNSQLWLIATSAPLAQLNKQRSDTLLPFGDIKEKEMLKDIIDCLKRDWDITTKKSLLQTLEDLPQSRSLTSTLDTWSCLTLLELNTIQKMEIISPIKRNEFRMVDLYRFSLGKHGDLSWHLGRMAWLIRCSAFTGLISENEAWELLEKNGDEIRKYFNNWIDFGLSHAVGSQFWLRANLTALRIKKHQDTLRFLLGSHDSPWMHVEWKNS